ncbi:NADH:flavin oxidoreductase [Barnesiella sp. CU968]|jgi:2,4-dienoyl-CoA reductase-like NADH-dependent reductase (Old Yellow Enzyme family)|uniref:NADH:flavin oxidoreductase n=1 Tax=Barnesiella sp. CU968 TaxID=2780099 RepID=UPI00195750F9|nr:NADH:flavin oxidoreductase [Barnesiella sp. CU968]MBJ2196593.1 NADH:flavin oxidoreductase [Muribaculaceae bacterium]MCI9028645.1 NADH:flavin oxidoreductase [Muribaculaceae bacterium]
MENKLFTPAKIGPVELRNRTIRSAAFEGMGRDNGPTPMLRDYHISVAKGGVGMTTLAYAGINRSALSFKTQLWLRQEIVDPLREITDGIHEAGAKASIQIGHCGNMTHRSTAGCIPVGASTGFNLYSPTFCRRLRKDELKQMAKDFGTAVNTARDAGFDCVEVHAGHGYLISQFLSPYTNRRRDEFGGSLENRMTFMKMCLEEVMKSAGSDMGVLVKTNMRDGFKGGLEIDDCLAVAREIERCGVHAMVLSGGFVSKAPMYVMRGRMPVYSMTHYMKQLWLKYGVRLAGKYMIPSVPFRELYFLDDARRFREALDLPLVYVGGVISRANADEVLDREGFDFVQMGRALLNEPDFVNRMRNDDTHRCGCDHVNYCIARMYSREMACHKHCADLTPAIRKEIEKIKRQNAKEEKTNG